MEEQRDKSGGRCSGSGERPCSLVDQRKRKDRTHYFSAKFGNDSSNQRSTSCPNQCWGMRLITHTHREFGDPMLATNRLQSSRPLAGVLPESLCDVTSWLMVSLSILSPPPSPPLPKVRDSCLLIFLILSMSGGREGGGGREAEGGGAASLETAPGQVGQTTIVFVFCRHTHPAQTQSCGYCKHQLQRY